MYGRWTSEERACMEGGPVKGGRVWKVEVGINGFGKSGRICYLQKKTIERGIASSR